MSREPDDAPNDLPPLDPRLRWLSEESLTDEQLGWLHEEAASDEALKVGLEALAPLDDRVFAAVAHRVHGAPATPPNRRTVLRFVAPPLALAAAAMLALTNGLAKPLPAYQFEWNAGQRLGNTSVVRSDEPLSEPRAPDADARLFRDGDTLDLTLRPGIAREGPVVVVVLVDGAVLDVTPEVFRGTGTVHVRGQIGAPPWDLAPGTHALTIAIGPSRAVRFGTALLDPRWQRFTAPLVVQ